MLLLAGFLSFNSRALIVLQSGNILAVRRQRYRFYSEAAFITALVTAFFKVGLGHSGETLVV